MSNRTVNRMANVRIVECDSCGNEIAGVKYGNTVSVETTINRHDGSRPAYKRYDVCDTDCALAVITTELSDGVVHRTTITYQPGVKDNSND